MPRVARVSDITLLVGGLVWSGVGPDPDVIVRNEAIAIASGRVLDVGSNRQLRRQYAAAQQIDLSGRTVVPGLIDGHCAASGDISTDALALGAISHCTAACRRNPWLSVWSMVAGGAPRNDSSEDRGHPISRTTALSAHTLASARPPASERGSRGRLERGWASDLAVLSDDYFRIDVDAIRTLRSELTIVGQTVRFSSGMLDAPTAA